MNMSIFLEKPINFLFKEEVELPANTAFCKSPLSSEIAKKVYHLVDNNRVGSTVYKIGLLATGILPLLAVIDYTIGNFSQWILSKRNPLKTYRWSIKKTLIASGCVWFAALIHLQATHVRRQAKLIDIIFTKVNSPESWGFFYALLACGIAIPTSVTIIYFFDKYSWQVKNNVTDTSSKALQFISNNLSTLLYAQPIPQSIERKKEDVRLAFDLDLKNTSLPSNLKNRLIIPIVPSRNTVLCKENSNEPHFLHGVKAEDPFSREKIPTEIPTEYLCKLGSTFYDARSLLYAIINTEEHTNPMSNEPLNQEELEPLCKIFGISAKDFLSLWKQTEDFPYLFSDFPNGKIDQQHYLNAKKNYRWKKLWRLMNNCDYKKYLDLNALFPPLSPPESPSAEFMHWIRYKNSFLGKKIQKMFHLSYTVPSTARELMELLYYLYPNTAIRTENTVFSKEPSRPPPPYPELLEWIRIRDPSALPQLKELFPTMLP
jgi:hypothetical protein